MNMRKYIFLFSLIIFNSCIPPKSKFYVQNFSNEIITIITVPSIENKLNLKEENKPLFDSIMSIKKNNSDEIGIYELKQNEKMLLYQSYGRKSFKPPYAKVEIVKSNDTLKINRENFKQLSYKKSNRNYIAKIN